ncbi:MAG: sugar transferase [Actinobacteria bacterium]|nr:sugar transferase [Actinomycetota bacterium]
MISIDQEVYRNVIKVLLDKFISILALIILAPLFATIGFKIKKDDGGPTLYRGYRVGKGGHIFKIYKFRTMVENADKIGGPSTSEDDPRITRVGRVLRKYKLDELPQLINVLKGEMSIVGPRPEVPSEVETYTEEERRILSVKPGITDWASIAFRNEGEILAGSEDPHQTYREKIKPEKLRLALKYVDEISFRTDMKIIFQTIKAVIKG